MNDIHSSIADDAKGQKMTNEVALLKLMYLHKKYLVPPHEENIENFLLRFLTFTQRMKKVQEGFASGFFFLPILKSQR